MCGEVTKNKVNDVLKVSWIYFFFFRWYFFSESACDPNISSLIYEFLWSVLWKSPLKLKKIETIILSSFSLAVALKFPYFLDRNFNVYFWNVSAINILGVTAWNLFLFRVRFGWPHVGLRVEETKSGS